MALTLRDGTDNPRPAPACGPRPADRYTRPVAGLSPVAGIFNSASGQVDWQITNLHGDLVATIDGDDDGLSSTSEADEYGTPRNLGIVGADRYGWLGADQRAADTPSGIVIMGVRLYNTVTGRFLQVDPIPGASCSAYDYVCADPVNNTDIGGARPDGGDQGSRQSCKCTTSNQKWHHCAYDRWSESRWYSSHYNNPPYRLKSFVKETVSRMAGYGVVTIDSIRYQYRSRRKIDRRCSGGYWQYRYNYEKQQRVRTVLSIAWWGDQTFTSRWGSGSASG